VYGAGDFASLDQSALPPPMPDWSPVRNFGGYAAWGAPAAISSKISASCACAHSCNLHGHDHASAWSSGLPVSDLQSFWGALGCACWAV
jgi:hypothetical protein